MSEAQLRQLMLGLDSTPGRPAGSPAPGQNPFLPPGMEEDPMMKLLSQMMGGAIPGMPGAGAAGGAPGAGIFPPGLVPPGQQQPTQQPQDPYASLWRILHFAVAVALGLFLVLRTPFTGTLREREDAAAVAAARGLGGGRDDDDGRRYFFWAFATAETVLLTSRLLLDRGRGPSGGGALWMAAGFLPPPFRGYAEVGLRYFQIFSTLRADILVCIFVLGVCAWWRG
jgi:GET complex subunit GET2